MSADRVLAAFVRRREGLIALELERTAELPWATSVLEAVGALSESLPIAVVEVGLDDLPPGHLDGAVDLIDAWRRLDSARITPESLADLLRVLFATCLDEPLASGISSFRGAAPLPPFRPTAAHPRAYEGTGARPPKERAPRRVDLQAVAVDPRATGILLDEFASMLPAALDLLPDNLASLARGTLSGASRGGTVGGWDGTGLMREFRVLVWPRVSALGEVEVGRLHAAFRRHPRHRDLSLHAAAAWCLAHASPGSTLPWLHTALRLPGRLAEVALLLWADSGAHDVRPDDVPLAEIAAGHDEVAAFALDLWSLLDAHVRHVHPRLMLPGLELARGVDPKRHARGAAPRELVASAPIVEFAITYLGDAWQQHAIDLWCVLSPVPGFADLFLNRPWSQLEPEAVELLVEAILWAREEDDHRSTHATWWADHLAATVDALREVPTEYQAKFADTVATCVAIWRDPDKRRALWPDLLRLTVRLARPPFRTDTRALGIWNNLLERHDAGLRRRVIEAPERLWLRLEKRSRVPAASRLLGRGLDALSYHWGDLLSHAFLQGTPLLFDVARLLGGMSTESADAICKSVSGSVDDPLSWLQDLQQRALDELGAGLGVDTRRRDVQHALLLQRSIDENRRALRRFLRAHMDGDAGYVLRHPLTRRWLASHPQLPLDRWLEGITLNADVEGLGELTLRLEQDPLEVLQLGTYVGSCLSLGGIFDFSAAAAALDINKQVVYARTRRGGVVARQLVAISEAGELVAFEVYPRSAATGLKRLFAEYDRRFSLALGLRMCTTVKEGAYEIDQVLSENWWDDGPWKVGPSKARVR